MVGQAPSIGRCQANVTTDAKAATRAQPLKCGPDDTNCDFMKTAQALTPNLVLLAQLLQRLDQSRQPVDGAQYRLVAQRLAEAMQQADHDTLQALLAQSPSAAELYENIHYAHAGLCRAPLEAALAGEAAARRAIAAARRGVRPVPGAAP